jgi:predicted nucleic acid-binding protein
LRAFLDANVLFSASKADSNIARLVAWLQGKDTAVSSDLAIEEARRNLGLKRPSWLPAFEALVDNVERVPSMLFTLPVSLPPKDAPLLCAAIRSRCRYFVTGDQRDCGRLMGQSVQGVEIVSPLRLAQILDERRNRGMTR